jgi:hypothetical protein
MVTKMQCWEQADGQTMGDAAYQEVVGGGAQHVEQPERHTSLPAIAGVNPTSREARSARPPSVRERMGPLI